MNIKDSYVHNGASVLKDIKIEGSTLKKILAGVDSNGNYLDWATVLDLTTIKPTAAGTADKVGHKLTFTGGVTGDWNGNANKTVAIPTKASWNYDDVYVKLSGSTMTGALTTPSLTVTGASTFSQAINGSILGNAATASRLLNARTINGTSFDGSANITIAPSILAGTSNTTKVTIKVGNQTSSEYTIPYAGTAGFLYNTTLLENSDINSYTASGYYTQSLTNICTSFTNGPTGRTNGEMYLLNIRCGGNFGLLLYYSRGTTNWQWWTRTFSGTTFSNWVQFIHSGNYTSYVNTTNFPGLNSVNVTSHLYVGGSSATSNATSAVSDPYLCLVEGSTHDSHVQLKASTGISISANNGIVTITNTSTNSHTYTSTWTALTANANLPIAISPNATPTTSGNGFKVNFTYNPSTNTLNVPNIIASGSTSIDDATIGNLVVTGAASFALTINGNITTADKVNHNLTIQLNGGSTEGTNKFTFNGSAAKSINITPNAIGAKATQSAVSDPSASGTGISYIATISQNAQGVITATKSTVRSASTSLSGIVTTEDLSFAGAKTFTGTVTISPTNTSGKQVGLILNDPGDGRNEALWINWTSSSHTDGVKLMGTPDSKKLLFHDGTNWNDVYHTGNLSPMTTSHAANNITSTNISNWNAVWTWYDAAVDSDTTGAINKWKELEAFLASITQADTLSGLLANRVAKSGDTMTGALEVPSLTVTGSSSFSNAINGSILGNAATASRLLNARTIAGVSFDGTSNITFTLDNIADGSTRKLSNYLLKVSALGSLTLPVYISSSGTFSACTELQGNAYTLNPTYNTIYGGNANVHYWKIAGAWCSLSHTSHNVYLFTTRNGESYYVCCSTNDSNVAVPIIKKITAGYSKIKEFRYEGRDLYLKTDNYDNRVIIRQIGGITQTLTITEITEETFNSTTEATIQTNIDSTNINSQSVSYANSAGSVTWSNVSSKPDTATRWPSWSEVTSKPVVFLNLGWNNDTLYTDANTTASIFGLVTNQQGNYTSNISGYPTSYGYMLFFNIGGSNYTGILIYQGTDDQTRIRYRWSGSEWKPWRILIDSSTTQTISGNKTFSGSTTLDDSTIGNLVVTGGASFALTINGNTISANKVNHTLTFSNSDTFDGSADLSVTKSSIGLGNVENTKLSTWTGTNKITTVGTIGTGTWNGTTIGVGYGGTGKTSWTQYGIVYASATDTLSLISLPTWAASTTYWLKCVTNASKVPTYSLSTISKSDVGLGNVDNTADENKNVNSSKYLSVTSSITSESSITESGVRAYSGIGSAWTGSIESMAYAAILTFGSPSRGWQMWARRANADGMYWRRGNSEATAWEDPRLFLDSVNYTSYTVTKTGTGASGTWEISITGNATTASTANALDWNKLTSPSITKSISSGSWTATGVSTPTTYGTYVVQVLSGDYYYSGIFSAGTTNDSTVEEIPLHSSAPSQTRLYLATKNKLFLISSGHSSATSVTFTITYQRLL